MVTSLQLSGLADSIRQDALSQLQGVCDEFGLSYIIDEVHMTITLPKYDEVELPVVGTIQVPTEDDEDAD
jgi:hypothetical protein